MQVQGLGFRDVQDVGDSVQLLGFRAWGSRFSVQSSSVILTVFIVGKRLVVDLV